MIEKQKVEIKFPERYITMPPMEAKKATTLTNISISTAVTHTFNTTSYLVELKNRGNYDVIIKYLTATDSNAVTDATRDIVLEAYETKWVYINTGVHTGFSILSIDTASEKLYLTEY